jgi:type IV pilus assembly protein PilO
MELTADKIFDKLPYEQMGKIKFLHLLAGAVCVGALLFAGFYLVFFAYMEEEYATLERKKNEGEAKLKSYQDLLARRDTVNMELVAVQSELAQIKRQMPQRGDITGFVKRAAYAANALGLEVALINRMPEEAKDYYQVVPLEILVRGGFYRTAAFLEAIQNLLRVVNITELHMRTKSVKSSAGKQSGERSVLETYSLALAYSYVEGAEDKPSPKKGKDGKDSKEPPKEPAKAAE